MKKGFTLVELLAVILILAIIALISTPIVLNVIKTSESSSSLISTNEYIRMVNNSIVKKELSGSVEDGIYLIDSELLNNINYRGSGPTNGKVIIRDKKVESSQLCINGYSIEYIDGESSISDDNYCLADSFNYNIKLTVNSTTNKYVGVNTTTTFEDIDLSGYKGLVCNNGAEVSYSSNIVTINNISKNVDCKAYASIVNINIGNADNSNKYVLMLSDETIDLPITNSEKLTIEMNGYDIINTRSSNLLNNLGDLTLKNSSETDSWIEAPKVIISGRVDSILNVDNIKMKSNDVDTSSYGIFLNGSNATIIDSSIEAPIAMGLSSQSPSNVSITNSELVGNKLSAVRLSGAGTLNIYSGEFLGEGTALEVYANGVLNIYGGTISGKDFTINSSGTVNIYGGRLFSESETSKYRPTLYGINSSRYNIYGGYISGQTNCDTSNSNAWKCSAVLNMGAGTIINVDGETPTFENGIYKSGLYIDSQHGSAVYNSSSNIINICGGLLDGSNYDVVNASSGSINYKNSNIFKNSSILDSHTPTKTILNGDLVCR